MNKSNKIIDSWLVLSYRAGDKKALSLLVKRWHPKFCRHAFRYTKDMDQAKDIVQESWRIIIVKLYKLRDADRFGSWAMMIVTRKALDQLARNKKEVRLDEGRISIMPASAVEQDNRENDLSRMRIAIAELPEEKRMILQLFYTEAYSLNEIAEILHISPATVKTRLFRAREKLKLILNT